MVITREQTRKGSLWLALGTTALVLILSIVNEVSLSHTFWRCVVSFGVVYGLTLGSIVLFERSGEKLDSSSELAEAEQDYQQEANSDIGQLFDQTAGSLDEDFAEQNVNQDNLEKHSAGQINDVLNNTAIDIEHQADIVRKMGWSTEDK